MKKIIIILTIIIAAGFLGGILFFLNNKINNLQQTVTGLQQTLTELRQSISPQTIQATSCGNGECDSGENLLNCSKDCFKNYCLTACQEQTYEGFTYDCASANVGEKFEAPNYAGTCCCTNDNAITK